ncbi:RNA-directed DNA polymerase, eukaryota, reverse transcriptase zinc-binding domain protein [Tanacetum coccineum]
MTRRSSNRHKKVPIKFNDTIHDLNNKNRKNSGASDEDDGNGTDGGMNKLIDNNEVRIAAEERGSQGSVLSGDGNGNRNVEDQENIVSKSTVQSIDFDKVTVEDITNVSDSDDEDDFVEGVSKITRCSDKMEMNEMKSYANVLNMNIAGADSNKLFVVPTRVNDKGDEVVIFDEELVREGSKKWENTACGYFIGCNMPVYEVKYNLRRMWGRHGLKKIIIDGDGMCFVKFKSSEGLDCVVDQSPWMVNGKPFIVQKWDPEVVTEKQTPSKLPVWIKMFNVPLEAWCKKTKWVKVEYTWKPLTCDHCKVFGHSNTRCAMRPKTDGAGEAGKTNTKIGKVDEGFEEVRYRKDKAVENNQKNGRDIDKGKVIIDGVPKSPQGIWIIGRSNMEELRKSVNKYAVLSEVNGEIAYFKYAWRIMEENGKEDSDEDDVLENTEPAVQSIIADEVSGIREGMELVKLMKVERLQLLAILETHLKPKNIANVCNGVFGSWNWISNVADSPSSCRIVVGWNPLVVKVMMLHSSKQSILCLVETIPDKIKIFISFVYASNDGIEIRELWNDLLMNKCRIGIFPWVLMGDFNVTLKPKEHSNGGSGMNGEFNDVTNNLEVMDICSTGFHFTWTKSLKNPESSILKKLDRMMVNEEFIQRFSKANGIFLPFLISDHSAAILIFPEGLPKKKRSFRFTNYIADKGEFIGIVKKGWEENVNGCYMFKVVKRLRSLKNPLNQLNWKHGNLFEKTIELRTKLQEAQSEVDKDPYNKEKRCYAASVLKEYTITSNDELKLLHQKAKVKWLLEGDKNTAYFHSVLKSRKHKSRIESICDDAGSRYWGDDVAKQFAKNFQDFLGMERQVTPFDQLGDIVQLKLPEDDAIDMISEVFEKEIKDAMFDIDSSKASGPDGYSSCFFKKAWGVVGKDVCLAIREFFSKGKLLKEINSTLIALCPRWILLIKSLTSDPLHAVMFFISV